MHHQTTESASASIVQEAVPMLDLQPFCGTDETRYYLMKPFSRDGFTWATDGCILIRVAQRPGVPEIEQKIAVSEPLQGIDAAKFFRPSFELPPAPAARGECSACQGRGLLHDCPDCDCKCEACVGSSTMDAEQKITAMVGPTSFSLKYIRQMLSLPDVELEEFPKERSEKPYFFRFAGGVGAVMPMRRETANHIDIHLVRA